MIYTTQPYAILPLFQPLQKFQRNKGTTNIWNLSKIIPDPSEFSCRKIKENLTCLF